MISMVWAERLLPVLRPWTALTDGGFGKPFLRETRGPSDNPFGYDTLYDIRRVTVRYKPPMALVISPTRHSCGIIYLTTRRSWDLTFSHYEITLTLFPSPRSISLYLSF